MKHGLCVFLLFPRTEECLAWSIFDWLSTFKVIGFYDLSFNSWTVLAWQVSYEGTTYYCLTRRQCYEKLLLELQYSFFFLRELQYSWTIVTSKCILMTLLKESLIERWGIVNLKLIFPINSVKCSSQVLDCFSCNAQQWKVVGLCTRRCCPRAKS